MMSKVKQFTDDERTQVNEKIENTFAFIEDVIDDPAILDRMPDSASIQLTPEGQTPVSWPLVQTKRFTVSLANVPTFDELDPQKVEFIFDNDHDELLVLYYGRERHHAVHTMTDEVSVLLDPMTGEVVGMIYHPFLETFVRHAPALLAILVFATILSKGAEQKPIAETLEVQMDPLSTDVSREEKRRSFAHEKIQTLKAFEVFAQPVG